MVINNGAIINKTIARKITSSDIIKIQQVAEMLEEYKFDDDLYEALDCIYAFLEKREK